MTHYKSTTGFSLVETLVAISILLIVIVGPMTISSKASKSTAFASEQVTAFFLAQEGAELAQKMRDDFLLESFATTNPNPDPWSDFGGIAACYTATGCRLTISDDGRSVTALGCSVSGCELILNPSAGRLKYAYGSGGSGVVFTRIIKFTRISADQIQVVSEVTWRTGSLKDGQKATVETVLFNVYGKP